MIKRVRLTDVDYVKAIAIVLVVYGHIVARETPHGNSWYAVSKDTLYLFHMPLFMFVSGLIFAYTLTPLESLNDYLRYLRRRVVRLLPAYIILAVAIVLGKMIAERFMHVDNAPSSIADLSAVFIRPYESPASFLWYVYVLVLYCITFPPLVQLLSKRILLLIPLGIALYFLPRTDLFGIAQYLEYFVFFAAGVVAERHLEMLRSLSDKGLIWLSLGFALLLVLFGGLIALGKLGHVEQRLGMLFMGFVAIPFFWGVVRRIKIREGGTLDIIAKYTFTIYLFNTICIGLVKGIAIKALPWDGLNFLVFLPVLWLAGVWLPVVFHRQVLARVPRLGKITI